MYVYLLSEPQTPLYTVGFFDPSGKWHPESDWNNRDEAAERVAYLNGSKKQEFINEKIEL